MDLKETDILGDAIGNHWYYRSKADAMANLLGSQTPTVILDVGAGSGFFSRHLLANTGASEAWCVDISYEGDSDEMVEENKNLHFRRSLDEDKKADVILLMDVLEHVDDPTGLLRSYVENNAAAGARILVSVPAFQFLWSGHDVFLGHKRRYSLPEIERVVEAAGLEIERGAYYFGMVFPIAAATRLIDRIKTSAEDVPQSQLTKHSPPVNGLLRTLSAVEIPLLRWNRWFGLTAFCLARNK